MTKTNKRDYRPKLRNPIARVLHIDRGYRERIVKMKKLTPKPITVNEAIKIAAEEAGVTKEELEDE